MKKLMLIIILTVFLSVSGFSQEPICNQFIKVSGQITGEDTQSQLLVQSGNIIMIRSGTINSPVQFVAANPLGYYEFNNVESCFTYSIVPTVNFRSSQFIEGEPEFKPLFKVFFVFGNQDVYNVDFTLRTY